jgi:hypothetical protein
MKKIILSLTPLASLIMASTPAFANLGDTKAQSIRRYGEISYSDGNWLCFQFVHWQLKEWVNPDNSLVELVVWTKKEVRPMTEAQMNAISEDNLPSEYRNEDRTWVKGDEKWVKGEPGYVVFFTKDLKYAEQIGVSTTGHRYMSISTMRAKNAIIEEEKSSSSEKQSAVDTLTLKLGI